MLKLSRRCTLMYRTNVMIAYIYIYIHYMYKGYSAIYIYVLSIIFFAYAVILYEIYIPSMCVTARKIRVDPVCTSLIHHLPLQSRLFKAVNTAYVRFAFCGLRSAPNGVFHSLYVYICRKRSTNVARFLPPFSRVSTRARST